MSGLPFAARRSLVCPLPTLDPAAQTLPPELAICAPEALQRGRAVAQLPPAGRAVRCFAGATAGGARAPSTRVSGRPRLAGRSVPAHGPADGAARGAGRVLGLRARQLAPHAALPPRVARPLRRGR